jgi:hypothetical protein
MVVFDQAPIVADSVHHAVGIGDPLLFRRILMLTPEEYALSNSNECDVKRLATG